MELSKNTLTEIRNMVQDDVLIFSDIEKLKQSIAKDTHTQGEWKIVDAAAQGNFIQANDDCKMCIAKIIEPNNPNWKANAKLIAAAPKLLECLEYVVSWLEDANVHKDIVENCKKTIQNATL